MPPPISLGRSTSAIQWTEIENDLGTKLPADYREFDAIYGEGFIGNELGISIGEDLGDAIEDTQSNIGVLRDEFPELYPVLLFPEPGGLLVWGGSGSGHHWYWSTESKHPDLWTVVMYEDGTYPPKFHRFGVSMTEYLVRFLRREWTDPVCMSWQYGTKYWPRYE